MDMFNLEWRYWKFKYKIRRTIAKISTKILWKFIKWGDYLDYKIMGGILKIYPLDYNKQYIFHLLDGQARDANALIEAIKETKLIKKENIVITGNIRIYELKSKKKVRQL